MPQPTQDLARFVNQLIVELPGTTDAGIRQAMFEVFHEFFDNTNAWQETIDVPIVANTTVYTLTPVETGEFVRLLGLVNSAGSAQPAVADMVGILTLRDTPNAADTWTATVAKTISSTLDSDGEPVIPEWPIARFAPCLSAGVRGVMMMQAKKPYTNPALGKYHLQRYRNFMGAVKSAVIHGNTYGANTWRFPASFATHSQRTGNGTDTSFGG